MTKRFLVFLISLVLVGIVAYAQTAEENFQKTSQTELAKRETILLQKKAEIEEFVDSMGNDAVISAKEMKNLKKAVAGFNQAKKNFDKELEFYSVSTETRLPELVQEHVWIYFHEGSNSSPFGLNNKDNKTQDIRRYFIGKTGQDVMVEKSKNYAIRGFWGFMVAIVISLLVALLIEDLIQPRGWTTLVWSIVVFSMTYSVFIFL